MSCCIGIADGWHTHGRKSGWHLIVVSDDPVLRKVGLDVPVGPVLGGRGLEQCLTLLIIEFWAHEHHLSHLSFVVSCQGSLGEQGEAPCP